MVDGPLVSKTIIVRFEFFILVKKEGPNKKAYEDVFLNIGYKKNITMSGVNVWSYLRVPWYFKNHQLLLMNKQIVWLYVKCYIIKHMRQKQVKNWCCFRNHVGCQVCFWNNIWHFCLFLHFFFVDLLPKRIKGNLEKYLRYLDLIFLNSFFVSKSFYDSIDFVQLDE